MDNLTEAEILIETKASPHNSRWFCLADYATMGEFLSDCASWFEEENPQYAYLEWSGIPHHLIDREWLCPNLFEIRDALQALDVELIDAFQRWCNIYGWNIATDDPYKLVSDFQNSLTGSPIDEDEEVDESDQPGIPDEYEYYPPVVLPGYSIEVFDDNYN